MSVTTIQKRQARKSTGETYKARHEDLVTKFANKYPKKGMENAPHNADDFTKDRLQRKLKRIKLNFRKAINSGRCSGG